MLAAVAITSVAAAEPRVRVEAGKLRAGDQAFRAVGFNRFDLAAGPKARACVRDPDIETLKTRQLATLEQVRHSGGQVVRLWAFQSLAGPSGTDFAHIDSLVDAARKTGVSLILVLENHFAECSTDDDDLRGDAWYASGYRKPYGDYKLSLPEYATRLVARYRDEPSILMWQVMNEASAPGRPELVRDFLAVMAQVIREARATQLIAGGGRMSCGVPNAARDFGVMADAAGIDVLDAHDYGEDDVAWPSCLQDAKEVADERNLVLMVGEAGMRRDPVAPSVRAAKMHAKMVAAANHGVPLYLLWSFNTKPLYQDSFDVMGGDPVVGVIRRLAQEGFAETRWPEPPPPLKPPSVILQPKATSLLEMPFNGCVVEHNALGPFGDPISGPFYFLLAINVIQVEGRPLGDGMDLSLFAPTVTSVDSPKNLREVSVEAGRLHMTAAGEQVTDTGFFAMHRAFAVVHTREPSLPLHNARLNGMRCKVRQGDFY